MPLKKVIADFGRGVFSPLNYKKGNHKNSIYQNINGSSLQSKHIYYEPPEELIFGPDSLLISSGDVIVHRLPSSPESNPVHTKPQYKSTPIIDTQQPNNRSNKKRAYTQKEFTSAILARTQPNIEYRKSCPTLSPNNNDVCRVEDMSDSGVMSMTMVGNGGPPVCVVDGGRDECDCERRCSNPKHECKTGDYSVSPILERRNKGVLGRLRNLASRTSYSTSEDGHSHSSDYEDQDDEKKLDPRFCRDSRERNSSSWAGRVRDLHRDVKKKISKLRKSTGATPDEEAADCTDHIDALIQPGSSVESIPSGSGSSLQPPTPTSSNRSSTSAGEDDHNSYVGTFIGRARALVDCTPSPYDRDGLAFKKGEIIDIIAKNKTGIWVGMAQGKVGHFKFINVEEILEERKNKNRHRKINNDYVSLLEKPTTLDELLKQISLEDYANVLVLNGYDELDTFKEIEKEDLDSLGIIDSDHCSKLLRAAEMLHDIDLDGDIEEESEYKQSPRDSGCYASHENLMNQDTPQRILNNGHFTVDLEDADTSHSESGIQSREWQDSLMTMNNLDLGADYPKSPPIEDITIISHNNNHIVNGHDSFNILPDTPDISSQDNISEQTVVMESPPSLNALNVPHFHATSGTKSSPGSPRKTRNKHSRNKSHSHRGKEIGDLPFQTHSFAKCRVPNNPCVERTGYIHGWSYFSRSKQSVRKNFNDYDEVLSDPATETEESPGKSVFRKVKQRKGSLQTLIHDIRPSSPTLISKVNKKLAVEKIYLHEEPYTDKTGFCGIPPALVQRYAEEIQRSIIDVAEALDQIRITALQQQARRGVPNDFLSDSCIIPVIEPNYLNLQSWLISLGLPMYVAHFQRAGMSELHHLATLSPEDLGHLGVRDTYHVVYLESAIETLYAHYQRRNRMYSNEQNME